MGWGDDRILNPLHYECIDFLVEAGIDLNTENTNGDTVLTSNFGKSKNAKLLGHLIASGAKVTDLAIARSMGGDSSLLRSLLVSYDKKISTNLITLARKDLRKDSSHLIALLERDFELYDEEYEIDSLLKDVSALDSELALGLLVNRGLVINIDRFHLALESALKNGSQSVVTYLVSRNQELLGLDSKGNTAIHRLIEEDATSSGSTLLLTPQQKAIAIAIDYGFPLELGNKDGFTITNLAEKKSSTANALKVAISYAGREDQGIHRAIRLGQFDELRKLAKNPNHRESLDTLKRTPLGLALQLENWSAVRILLREGAIIGTSRRNPWQDADITYAEVPEITYSFAVSLLKQKLLDIPADLSNNSLRKIRENYTVTQAFSPGDWKWQIDCVSTFVDCDWDVLSGGESLLDDKIVARTIRDGSTSRFGLIQNHIRSIRFQDVINLGSFGAGRINDEVTWLVRGEIVIPGCTFSFEYPNCVPGLKISNHERIDLSFLVSDGYEQLPVANLRYEQANGSSGSVKDGEFIILDRSEGDITLKMDVVRARVFMLWLEIENILGLPVNPRTSGFSIEKRMELYKTLFNLRHIMDTPPDSPEERAKIKTAASAIYAMSAEAYLANYHLAIIELLKQQAQTVANLSLRALRVRDAVVASATLTPDAIEVLIAQVEQLTNSANTADLPFFINVISQLQKLKESAEENGEAINSLKDTLYSEADLAIEKYQALILELSQYIPPNELKGIVPDDWKTSILERINGRDVLIFDNDVNGQGETLRNIFSLPDPRKS